MKVYWPKKLFLKFWSSYYHKQTKRGKWTIESCPMLWKCTVVPFITVWALICFLPEICRIILSVKMLFFWLTEISLASDNWTCENSIFSIFSLFSGQHFVTLQIHYTAIENANIAFHKVENNVFMHSNVSFKHSNYVDIVSQSNVVSYEISVHICLVLDFFQNSRFSTFKI